MLSFLLLSILLNFIPSEGASYYYNAVNGSNEAWKSRMQNLLPGDILTFGEGTYTLSSKISVSWPGTAAAPITIRGEPGKVVKFNRPNQNQNTIDIGSGSYFILENIQFVGGSKGVRMGETGNIQHSIFRNLKIYGTGTTAMSANDVSRTHTNVTVRYNEVYNTGSAESECFYFGCNNAGCTFKDSLIEYNYCHDTIYATSGSLGSGIQVKTGSYNNIIRNNVVINTKGAGILVYDDYDLGVNIVQGNYLSNNQDNGIQATSGTRIFNNVISKPGGGGIVIQANQLQTGKQLRNTYIAHNTIVSSSTSACLRIGSTSATTFTILNNAIFCSAGQSFNLAIPAGANIQKNAYNGGSGLSSGTFLVGTATTELASPSTDNFYPKSTSALKSVGTSAAYSVVTTDFNCKARSSTAPTVGAYEYSTTTNPGWLPTGGFKVC